MNTPTPINILSFKKISNKLGDAYLDAANESMKIAAFEAKVPDVDPIQIVDTRVAIDGTWQKRGYS